MNKRCVIVFPPAWDAAAPYLAGPSLAAYLRVQGQSVELIDANLMFWRHFKDISVAKNIFETCQQTNSDPNLLVDEAIAAEAVCQMGQIGFLNWIQRASITNPLYKIIVRRFGGFRIAKDKQEDSTLDYHDGLFADISASFASEEPDQLKDFVLQNKSNPWRQFARKYVMSKIADIEPNLLGLTIAGPNQVVAALTLAVEAQKFHPNLQVVLGGAWVTLLRENLSQLQWLRDLNVNLVAFQGETALLQMSKGNLFSSSQVGVDSHTIKGSHISLAELPTPDFSGLPLEEYGESGHLPLMASKGCYWGKCRFCSYPALEPCYETRPFDLLVEDLRQLVHKHQAQHIAFGDPSVSPAVARQIVDSVAAVQVSLSWGALARFEKDFTHSFLADMASAGCTVLHWGLESGSERMHSWLRKGINLSTASRVLQDAAAVGIHNRVLMMYGMPGETEEDLEKSLTFVENHLDVIGSLLWCRFAAERGTRVWNDLASDSRYSWADYSLSLGVKPPLSISKSVLEEAEARMEKLSSRVGARLRSLRLKAVC